MRMVDGNGKQHFWMQLFLTRREAQELIEVLQQFLLPPDDENFADSYHLFDEELSHWGIEERKKWLTRFKPAVPSNECDIRTREIQLEGIYDFESTGTFDERTRALLEDVWGVLDQIDPKS